MPLHAIACAHSLQTTQGTTTSFNSATVLVQDITVTDPTTLKSRMLDGNLGMNFIEPLSTTDLSQINTAPFNWVIIDQPNGLLGLTLVPEPASALLLSGLLSPLRRKIFQHPMHPRM